ncbi:segregation/condensation protein A [Fischerella thermalis]|jgi:segregation and condensation protein A|uniref:Segregation and condensation protein A n=1 Tax=Fischerella thermalis JSC-11 TaxID=741277 RepID=G6FSC8_9CYAN|nr:ScpA family protein [Fischerella thermalis]PMB05078.1 segregation/condensation protein A [Fischerella thermalis CCMEE 5328]EHC15113.1 chromosome segregation and condensation protein ScpA [Fischerella thermalis JSC-11]PLZ25692.1 segregation/condensation protein A [Fischerella thermalis WC341]PLZ26505.1 segregation/condensation protein A [Fischerella thermalis WC559]PLZ29349.1 segregation/condensation protein A [Fischerella thermalis WC558]
MNPSELLATIENLIHQAEKGEIDPWDVQVIDVIDRYIELMTPQTTQKGYEADLSQSGQAFLSASMLVLFKANTLMQLQSAAEEQAALADDNLLEEIEEGGLYQAHRLQFERHIRRRPAAMPPPKRRVTLQELMEQLQVMAEQLKLVEKVKKPSRPRRQPSLQTMQAALELAHQENLTEVAGELEQVLYRWSTELCLEQNWLNLEQLVELWTQTKQSQQHETGHNSPNGHKVSVFWALLLLSAQSKVELFQEEFYQDVKIRLLTGEENNSRQLEQLMK